MIFSPDFKEFISSLNKYQVKYVLVGGKAVVYHGFPRFTGDYDLFFQPTESNAELLFLALTEFWKGSIPHINSYRDLFDGIGVQFGIPPHRIDLLNSLGSIPFDDVWKSHITDVIDGIEIKIIDAVNLLRSKRVSNRSKDLEDIAYLERKLGVPSKPKS